MLSLLDKKADRADLDALEKRILDRLNEILRGLIDRFADKKETNKRLTNIEKQVIPYFNLFNAQN